jgi:signal transduction histidine kinase
MLSFVRGGAYEKGSVPLDGAVDRALELVGFQGRLRAVEVARDYAAGLPPVRASEGELRQVLLIVVTNALDAMQDRGSLHCRTCAAGGCVAVEITDSGPGIPEEHRARLFTPFFTTKAERGGTGLGLSIARRIVEDAGGTISIASRPGSGATVTISLPSA